MYQWNVAENCNYLRLLTVSLSKATYPTCRNCNAWWINRQIFFALKIILCFFGSTNEVAEEGN